MVWVMLGLLSLVPLAGFGIVYRLLRGRLVPAVVAAGVVGAVVAAFLASAGSAMATAVDPSTALLRGLGIGFLGGTAIGGAAATVVAAWRRRRAGGS